MPLARMAMYGKGVEIYLAPTADSRDTWQATLRHIALRGALLRAGLQPVRDQGRCTRPTWRGCEDLAEPARRDVPRRRPGNAGWLIGSCLAVDQGQFFHPPGCDWPADFDSVWQVT